MYSLRIMKMSGKKFTSPNLSTSGDILITDWQDTEYVDLDMYPLVSTFSPAGLIDFRKGQVLIITTSLAADVDLTNVFSKILFFVRGAWLLG